MSTTKVLLADDDQDDRELFSEALASLNLDVVYTGVEDGKEALDVLLIKDARPSIIFLDINMPVMSGWDVLRQLKNDLQYVDIPVIVYSTSSGQRERKTAFELGALCFVTKPDNIRLIRGMLEIVLKNIRSNVVDSEMCHEIQRVLRGA